MQTVMTNNKENVKRHERESEVKGQELSVSFTLTLGFLTENPRYQPEKETQPSATETMIQKNKETDNNI